MIATIRGFVFLVFSCDCFSLYLSLFCFFVPFCQNGRLFLFLRNTCPSIEILKNLNFRNISTLLRSTFLLLRPLVVLFCPAGRLRCANLAEWHTLPGQVPINVPIDRITPGYRQVVFQFSIISLTNRIRK